MIGRSVPNSGTAKRAIILPIHTVMFILGLVNLIVLQHK